MLSEGLLPEDAPLVAELVAANQILYRRAIVDAFGHVSLRRPHAADTFLISRSLAPQLVGPDDIQACDLQARVVGGNEQPGYLERFIHSEVYRVRPDVMAVVHSHSPAVLPFSVVPAQPLRPVCHMAGFIGTGAPVFEIRDAAGDGSDLLIRTRDLGRELAETLGQHAAVLMRGHGSTVVGASLEQAVFRANYLETNARIQLAALQLGDVTFLTPAEAEAASRTNDGGIGRAYALWKHELAQ